VAELGGVVVDREQCSCSKMEAIMGTITQQPTEKVSWARARSGQDRRIHDRRHWFAGNQLRKTASLQKLISMATGYDASWVSRQCNGDPSGVVQRCYSLLERLALHPKCDPTPILVGGLVVVREALAILPRQDLERRILGVLMAEETRRQAEEDQAEIAALQAFGTPEQDRALEEWAERKLEDAEMALQIALMIRARRYAR